MGLTLSIIGSWALAKFSHAQQQAHAKQTVKSFCIDVLKNIKSVVSELEQTREKAPRHPPRLSYIASGWD